MTRPFPNGLLVLERLVGSEKLGRFFKFHVGLRSTEPAINPGVVPA
jgi:uncharacterized protein involved in type VI secretion and phage assembly